MFIIFELEVPNSTKFLTRNKYETLNFIFIHIGTNETFERLIALI